MTTHDQIHNLETKLERDRRILLILQMVVVFFGTLLLIAIAGACSGCSATPQDVQTPQLIEVHGCGGSTIQWGGFVLAENFCEHGIKTPTGMKQCTVIESASVNGMLIGRGAVEALSAPECEAVYGWFPSGLVVGSHDDGGIDGSGDVGAPSAETGGAVGLDDLGIAAP